MSFKRKRQHPTISIKDRQSKSETECPVPFKDYNSKVNLFASRCRLRKILPTKAQISKYHILEKGNTGQEICCKILNTYVGLDQYNENLNFDDVISALSPILELFKNRHNKFNYLDKLKCIVAKGAERYAKQKYKNQVHMRLMQTFFKTLLHEIVPMELFGTAQNIKIIKNTIYRLLKTIPQKISIKEAFRRTLYKRNSDAIGASLDIKPLLKRFNISTIKWLHSIKNNTEQWIIILKLLHWFFAQYIVKILHKYIVLISLKKQWIYIIKDDWCRMQEEFIKDKETTGALIPWTSISLNESNISIGIYKFIPSSSGLRALFLIKYSIKKKFDDIDVTLRFLQQLYITCFNKEKMPTVASCQKDIYSFKKSIKNRLYYVRCDIQDAFGSIIQEKLYDIIRMYCRELPIYLRLRTYTLSRARKSYRKNSHNKASKIQTVQFLDLKKALKNIREDREKPRLVLRTKLLAKIQKLIFQQKVKLNDRVYSIKLGVPQGMPTSSILSDIYYQHMIEKVFPMYARNGLLCTYVDDILYITENEGYATEFLELVRNGLPDYNVKFNPSKIESNVNMPYIPTKIKFLGCNVQF